MPRHPGTAVLLVSFFDCGGGFGEAVQEHSGAGFLEELQNTVTSLPHSQPGLSELAIDLRGVRKSSVGPPVLSR